MIQNKIIHNKKMSKTINRIKIDWIVKKTKSPWCNGEASLITYVKGPNIEETEFKNGTVYEEETNYETCFCRTENLMMKSTLWNVENGNCYPLVSVGDRIPRYSLDRILRTCQKFEKELINIKGIDKAEILSALYNNSKPQGLGVLWCKNKFMTKLEAKILLDEGKTYFKSLYGRIMKIDLSGDYLDSNLYDSNLYDCDLTDKSCQMIIDKLK